MKFEIVLDDKKIKILSAKASVDIYKKVISINQKEFNKILQKEVEKTIKKNILNVVKTSIQKLK